MSDKNATGMGTKPPAKPRAVKPVAVPAPVSSGSPLEKAARVTADELVEDAPAKKKKEKPGKQTVPMSAFRVEVGRNNEITPANIVGAIANETGLEAKYIGRIEIFEDHSMLELPDGMPEDMFRSLGKVWVGGAQLKISQVDRMPPESVKHTPPKKPAPGAKAKKKY